MGKRPAGRHEREPMAMRQQRWMGQVVETDDGLPCMGEHAHRACMATGFCGNGCTLGTLRAMMARDLYVDATGARAETDTLDDVKKGEGNIARWHGRKHTPYRDDAGHVTVCSPVCTPLHWVVRWNTADHIWDWPCYGPGFHATGAVLRGLAEALLEPIDLAALQA